MTFLKGRTSAGTTRAGFAYTDGGRKTGPDRTDTPARPPVVAPASVTPFGAWLWRMLPRVHYELCLFAPDRLLPVGAAHQDRRRTRRGVVAQDATRAARGQMATRTRRRKRTMKAFTLWLLAAALAFGWFVLAIADSESAMRACQARHSFDTCQYSIHR